MKWEKQKSDDGFYRLQIEAEWSEIATDYTDIIAGYSKVQMPGFRTGKVPRSVIEKRFKAEINQRLEQQVTQRLGREAVRGAGIEILGPAEAEMIECCKGQLFRARLRFYPMPEINLPDLRSIDINCRDADPRDLISLSLLELVDFQIPDGLVREALALDGIEVKPGSDAWQVASDQVRLMLILKRVARQEGIEVDQTDVEKRISEKAREFGTTDKSLKVELENGGGMQRLKEMLIAESTLEYILEINSK